MNAGTRLRPARADGPPVADGAYAVTTTSLGKRYRARWALRDCTIEVPRGAICGLVGANGAGKTTLLKLLVGLGAPTSGTLSVLGQVPRFEPGFLHLIGYLAQDVPLYRRWTVADHLTMGRRLNPRWDDTAARDRLAALGIPLDQRIATLSGGQRAQVALALALAKRPQLLILDEPVAALDPLARREFLGSLAAAVADASADEPLTVVLSSHLVSDLERICDYLVVLDRARTQLCGELEEIVGAHALLTGPVHSSAAIKRVHTVLREDSDPRRTSLLVRLNGPVHDPAWTLAPVDLEDVVLAYLAAGASR
jgi:ABC-2 type transport system ATP-binding protein